MDVFISWSGDHSKKIGEAIREWLPCVIQAVKPYFTPEDISKGQRWGEEISKKLESSKIGIIILTPTNLEAPWLMFEAGALSKSVERSRVCPLLFDIKPTDIKGPLVQFQLSTFNKQEALKLIRSINSELDNNKLDEKTLTSTFEAFWPILSSKIDSIKSEPKEIENPKAIRDDREILEEILRLTRKSAYSYARTPAPDKFLERFEKKKPVTFDPEAGSISFWSDGLEVYEFSIARLSSGAEVLDWILQVSRKGWCTGEHIKSFIECIEEISDLYFENNAQGVFCPSGFNNEIDWGKALIKTTKT